MGPLLSNNKRIPRHRLLVWLVLSGVIIAILMAFSLRVHLNDFDQKAITADFQLPSGMDRPGRSSHNSIPALSASLLEKTSLMGREPSPESLPEIEATPETTRDVKLAGVFANSSAPRATALISVNGAEARYFYVGEEVISGLALMSVSAQGVMLKSADGFEKLVFEKPSIWTALVKPELNTARKISSRKTSAAPLPTSRLEATTMAALMDTRSKPDARDEHEIQSQQPMAHGDRLAGIRAMLKGKP